MKREPAVAVRWRREMERSANGGNWRSQASSGGGSLRLYQRRLPEQQKSQSDTRSSPHAIRIRIKAIRN
jgi:hypothetical protein